MELNHIKSISSHSHVVLHPATGQPLKSGDGKGAAKIVIASPNDPEYRKRQHALNQEIRELSLMSDKETALDTASARAAAIAVTDWGDLTLDGNPIASNPVAALSDQRMAWLVNQILQVQATSANFIETSARG